MLAKIEFTFGNLYLTVVSPSDARGRRQLSLSHWRDERAQFVRAGVVLPGSLNIEGAPVQSDGSPWNFPVVHGITAI